MGLQIIEILKKTQEELLEFCAMKLLFRGYKCEDITYTKDYLYAKGKIPVLLVAHCDIVHKDIPETILFDKKLRMLWSPTGIGGDDRCGVYAILKILDKYKPYVLFTTDEECGGLGVKQFVKDIDEIPVNFIIEVDRRGNKQAVFYQCGNKEFQNYILSFGFDKQTGSYSDVSTLSTHYDIAGVNLSGGYYNEHTKTEYIDMNHLDNTIKAIGEILEDSKNHKFYDCQEIKWKPKKYTYYKWNEKKKCYEWDYTAWEGYDKEDKKLLKKEDDFYLLSDKEWEKKYKEKRPKSVDEIYKK